MRRLFLVILLVSTTTTSVFADSSFSLKYNGGGAEITKTLVRMMNAIATKGNVIIDVKTVRKYQYGDPTFYVDVRGTFQKGNVSHLSIGSYEIRESLTDFFETFLYELGAENISVIPNDEFGLKDSISASWSGNTVNSCESHENEILKLKSRIEQLEKIHSDNQ